MAPGKGPQQCVWRSGGQPERFPPGESAEQGHRAGGGGMEVPGDKGLGRIAQAWKSTRDT